MYCSQLHLHIIRWSLICGISSWVHLNWNWIILVLSGLGWAVVWVVEQVATALEVPGLNPAPSLGKRIWRFASGKASDINHLPSPCVCRCGVGKPTLLWQHWVWNAESTTTCERIILSCLPAVNCSRWMKKTHFRWPLKNLKIVCFHFVNKNLTVGNYYPTLCCYSSAPDKKCQLWKRISCTAGIKSDIVLALTSVFEVIIKAFLPTAENSYLKNSQIHN